MKVVSRDSKTNKLSVEEMEIATEKIIMEGLEPKKSFISYIKECSKNLGIKVIFHDIIELLILSFIIMFLYSCVIASVSENSSISDTEIYMLMFIMSPILQLITLIFTLFNTKQKHTFELEMTFKYNILKLSAFRMFIFSIVTVVLNTIVVLILNLSERNIDLLKLWSISMLSVFLFSSLFLFFILKLKRRWSKYLFITIWVVINLGLFNSFSTVFEKYFITMPIFVHLGIALVCSVIYVINLRKLINFRSLKGEM